MQGFLLGLANGTTCLAYCGPVLLPYLVGEARSTTQNFSVLGQFLCGRLSGYLLFGLIAWLTSRAFIMEPGYRALVFSVAYILLSVALFVYGVFTPPAACAAKSLAGILHRLLRRPALFPVLLGFLTGLNLCPPFLLAFTKAVNAGGLGQSLFFFFTFFLGTAVYFIPTSLVGRLNNVAALQTIGKLSAALTAIYYFYLGLTMIGGNNL